MEHPGDDDMTLEKFHMFSAPALKSYLYLRGKSTDGTFDELAARAYVTYEEKICVNVEKELQEQQNLEEYRGKLTINGTIIPDPFTLKSGWLNEKGMQFWPPVILEDISEYLKMKNCDELKNRLINEYKEGKAYRYYSSGWVEDVYFHDITPTSDVCIFSCKVSASMRLRIPPYQVWAAVAKTTKYRPGGKIFSAYCTCTAGLNGTCNHIAAMLFRVQAAVSQGLTNPTCTSRLATWNVPSECARFEPHKPIKLSEQVVKRDNYFHADSSFHESLKTRQDTFSCMNESQEHDIDENMQTQLGDKFRLLLPNSCFVQLLDAKPFVKPPKPVCPTPLIDIAVEQACRGELSVTDLVDACTLSGDDIQNLNAATVTQSNSSDWVKQRQGRITASDFARVDSKVRNLQRNPDVTSLVKHIVGVEECRQTADMKHGKSLEPKAKVQYSRLMRKTHKKFTTENSGLVVSSSEPYLGASLDLVVECACHGKGLCEIKCPSSIANEVPSSKNYSKYIVVNENGEDTLSRKCDHYLQIQGQLGICKLNYCDIFVYTNHGHFCERIQFDACFWHVMLCRLKYFWLRCVAPSLLLGKFARKKNVAERGVSRARSRLL